MSTNENSWKDVTVSTTIAAAAFCTGGVVDLVISTQTGKPSNVGRATALSTLAVLHLNEVTDIFNNWVKA